MSTPDWSAALERAGLDRTQQTVWVAEGLIHYLPPPALRWWLTDAVSLSARPWLVVTTIRPEVAAAADGRLRRLLRFIEEIPAVYFTAEDLRAAARLAGWSAVEVWQLEDQVREFAPAAAPRPRSVSQDVALFQFAPVVGAAAPAA
jgi:O-methyltransferase involved in polyketide biosynthesis